MDGRCTQCGAVGATDRAQGICLHCLMQREGADPLEPGSRFAALEIQERVGQGGMGVVYKALQKDLGRTVALKVLPAALAADADFAERFTREAKALAQLSHPNIVTLHECGVHDQVPYFVMEYVEGSSLRALLAGGKLAPARALELVPQICDALHYAHGRGVIHRDIKPENILLDREGRIKIADFGLAKFAQEDSARITKTSDSMGTPHYMAPEQIENPREVDHRADIFSLGVVFYEMLTGELPIGRFRPPSEKSGADARLDPIVLKSLEKERELRYQSAEEVKTHMTHLGPLPQNPQKPGMLPRRALAWLSMVLAGLLVVTLVPLESRESHDSFVIPAVAFASMSILAGFAAIALMIRAKDPSGSRMAGTGIVLSALLLHVPLEDGLGRSLAVQSLPALVLLQGLGEWLARRARDPRWSWRMCGAALLFHAFFFTAVASFIAAKYAYSLEPAAWRLLTLAGGLFLGALILSVLGLIQSIRSKGQIPGISLTVSVLVLSCVLGPPLLWLDAAMADTVRQIRLQVIEKMLSNPDPSQQASFRLEDAWPAEGDLPEGQFYETLQKGVPAAKAASIPPDATLDIAQLRYATLKPSNITLIGLQFRDESSKSHWQKQDAFVQLGHWNDRIDGGLSSIVIGYDHSPWATPSMWAVWSAVTDKVKEARQKESRVRPK